MEFLESLRRLEEDTDDIEEFEHSPVHTALEKRFRSTLYLGKATEGISLPVADVAVDLFQNAAEKNLGTFTRRHVAKFNRNGQVNPASSMLGMMYARRLKRRNSDFLQTVTSTELFLVSMMLATKFLYDEGEDEEIFSDEWADSANMDVKKVNELEREFLEAIDWDLYIKPDEFYQFLQQMEVWIALSEGGKRGWFSYSDMNVLMEHKDWYATMTTLLQQSIKVLSICLAVYTVCTAMLSWSVLVMQYRNATIPEMSTDANHSHIFCGMRPVKATQVASHQSEIFLPFITQESPSLEADVIQDVGMSEADAHCDSCPECQCSDCPVDVEAHDRTKCRHTGYGTPDLAEARLPAYLTSCKNCCKCRSGELWLRMQIASAQEAVITFYHALLVAYYDMTTHPLAHDHYMTAHIVKNRSHHINKSKPHIEHDDPVSSELPEAELHCAQQRHLLGTNGNTYADSSPSPQCSVCDAVSQHRTIRETVHALLPTSILDNALGSITSTIPVIIA